MQNRETKSISCGLICKRRRPILYRKLPKGEEKLSILGIGTSSIQASGEKEIENIISAAIENGINFFDMASSEAKPFAAYGRAIAGVRDKVYFQIHFGANYETGTYGWTTNLDTVKRSVDWQLKSLQSDYIDFGFIHCMDESADLHEVEKNGMIRYIGYWKQWFNRENIGEENRLAYVAFSRARYLLALGIPKPQNFSEGDRKVLKDAGFEIIDN